MRTALKCCVVLLMSVVAMAQAAPSGSARKKSSGAMTSQEARELRQALAAQGQQIQQMQEEMRRRDQLLEQMQQALAQAQTNASTAQEKAAAAQSLASQQGESVSKVQSDLADVKLNQTNAAGSTQEDQKRVAKIEDIVGRFRFTGDVRVRGEAFFQPGVQNRIRERIRLRFGFQGKLNEDFSAGIFLASGAVSNGNPSFVDPVSTNETLTSFFERKTVGFDRGWITYNPQNHKWLELTGGKWAYTWNRTELMFDNDLNPEGFSEKASFNLKNNVFKNVTFQAMQLMFNEVNGGSPFPGFDDSYAVGGAFNTRIQLGQRVTITPSYSILGWVRPDSIAQATVPLGGAARIINANSMTNATRNCGAGAPFPALCRLGGTAHTEFVSEFLNSDLIVDVNVKTPWARWPFRVFGEYEKNLGAVNRTPAEAGGVLVGKQDTAFYTQVSLGQTRNKNDVQVGYSFAHVEQDAVISQFNESDWRAPTNLVQHRLFGQWKVRNNITAAYTLFIGRTLDCRLQNRALSAGVVCPVSAVGPAGNLDKWLKRMQFDIIYSF